MTSRDSPITTNCTAVSVNPPALTDGPWLIVYETLVPPARACTPNSMMRVIPRETITIVIGAVPRRWKGAYTPALSSTDPAEQAATATTRQIQMFTPWELST